MPRLSKTALALATALLAACSDPATTDKVATASLDQELSREVIQHYGQLAHALYGDALTTARQLQQAVQALLDTPSAQTLDAAREAWKAARVPYSQTEAFRFGNLFIDEWEGQVNAWPLDEGLIDYVADSYEAQLGNPGAYANIIGSTTLRIGDTELDLRELTPELLASLNELGGSEANVATGYHAIEFLLWGQDLNGTGPGAGERPYTDYLIGDGATGGHNERRRRYLEVVTALLVSDLEEMVAAWAPDADNERAALLQDSPENTLRKMLFGIGSLSLGELAGERMKVALEANSPEDEHDCFSDNTHHSHFYNQRGVVNIYMGEYIRADGSRLQGPGLSALVHEFDPEADARLQARLADTTAAMQQLVDSAERDGVAFDQLIAPGNQQGAALVNQAIQALLAQTDAIEQAAGALGIRQLNPDTADHTFQ